MLLQLFLHPFSSPALLAYLFTGALLAVALAAPNPRRSYYSPDCDTGANVIGGLIVIALWPIILGLIVASVTRNLLWR